MGFELLQSVIYSQVAFFWTSNAFPTESCFPVVPRCSRTVGPLCLATQVHALMKPSLEEFLPPPSSPTRRSASTSWVSSPTTASLRLAPNGAGCSKPTPGSALRFFQPPSGFPADPSFAALFHAATVPGVPLSECSPRRKLYPLSRADAPFGYPPTC